MADVPSSSAENAAEEPCPLPLTPPTDCVQITPDAGVLKHIVRRGAGEVPVLHSRCLVHFVGRLLPSGEVFMSSRDDSQSGEPLLVVAGRDASPRETGLSLAVASMMPGEQAWVYITDPVYGYGDKGSFSFPCVPPGCQLVYEVDMLTWEPPSEDTDRRSMLYEERLEAAERRRLEGNQLFADGKFTEALGKYALALSYCDEDFMLQLHGPHLDKAEEVTNPVLLNMAAVQIKLGDHAAAAHNATQVLMRDPKHVKALFRRGKARSAMGRTTEALEDLSAAATLDPDDKQIQRELLQLQRTRKDEERATAKLFKGSPVGSGLCGGDFVAVCRTVAGSSWELFVYPCVWWLGGQCSPAPVKKEHPGRLRCTAAHSLLSTLFLLFSFSHSHARSESGSLTLTLPALAVAYCSSDRPGGSKICTTSTSQAHNKE